MTIDLYTKGILTVIAVALVIIVAKDIVPINKASAHNMTGLEKPIEKMIDKMINWAFHEHKQQHWNWLELVDTAKGNDLTKKEQIKQIIQSCSILIDFKNVTKPGAIVIREVAKASIDCGFKKEI
jgi:hypothetical protein